MNKKYIISKNEEIQDIIKKSKKIVSKYFIVYYISNDYKYNRFCISISKKIGKSNIRNLYKRRIKDILMKNIINSSNNYVIILRNAILDIDYSKMSIELLNLLKGK